MVRRLLPLAVLSALAACVSADYMPVGPNTFPPRPDDWVIEVYLGVDAPVRVHKSIEHPKSTNDIPANAELIGRVDAAGDAYASWNAIINAAKDRARKLGGDGIVIGSWGSTMTHVGSWGETYYGSNVSVQVIRYNP